MTNLAMKSSNSTTLAVLAGLADQPVTLLVGSVDILALYVYVNGYRNCMTDHGLEDDYLGFREWLHAKRPQIHSKGGWHKALLEDANGDHGRAIQSLVALVKEYQAGRS